MNPPPLLSDSAKRQQLYEQLAFHAYLERRRCELTSEGLA
jgi:hypothetical protein